MMRFSGDTKATALIAAILLAGTLVFAWARSGPVPGADSSGAEEVAEPADELPAAADPGGAAAAEGQRLGSAVYARECAPCHGNDAADRAELGALTDAIYRRDDGAAVLEFLLRGGPQEEHPPFDDLSDEQIAALLAYLLAYGDGGGELASGARPVISAADVAAGRTPR